MNVYDLKSLDINTSLEWSEKGRHGELNGLLYTPETMADLCSDWINMQLLFRDLLAILPLNLMLTDPVGRILAATPKLQREVLHLDRDGLGGCYLSVILRDLLPDTKPIVPLVEAMMRGAQWRGELRFKTGQYVGVRMCPLPLGDDTVCVLLFEPLEENLGSVWLKRLMGLVDESREMITRGRISGGVMHDVKNMVQNLSGNVQCMQLKSPNDNMRVRLDMMSRQIGEMSQLVNSYLQMGKESMSSLDCSVNALLSQTVGLMSGTLGMNRIEIFTDLAEDLPELCVDGTRLKQVFMNCLENSLDAIVERRRNIDPKEKFYGEVWVRSCGSEGGGIDIIIEDNGVGLTEEQERRFFEPFFTTKQGGHGIGASFSRAVVELHGGVMRANNRPEGGCRVVIALPAVTKLSGRKINLYDELAELNW